MEKKITNSFWHAYNSSRCKTTMAIISIVVVFALAITEVLGMDSPRMWEAFLIVIGYWVGRGTKVKDDLI